ncbi:hypothetical protein FB556_0667 [Enteractinococcus coprophilus]|uniref:Uncharacterized protein n=1 Tax=Enteractinococcus coprophilus TaxID=1027633 RepID=A0A543ANQ9_9MICC|nr:hypothetical protein FB556_0667 [Enteractinococcus coprophilus]
MKHSDAISEGLTTRPSEQKARRDSHSGPDILEATRVLYWLASDSAFHVKRCVDFCAHKHPRIWVTVGSTEVVLSPVSRETYMCGRGDRVLLVAFP